MAAPAERDLWLKQYADMLSAAYQEGTYPDGAAQLKNMLGKLIEAKASQELIAHFQFAAMQADFGRAQAEPKADAAKVQEAWVKQLEEFVDKYQSGEQVAEALLQLGMYSDAVLDNESATKRYQRLVADFPDNPRAAKARGALARLQCEGKPIALKGPALAGQAVDLAQYRGKVVLIHYWSLTAPNCEADHKALVEVYKKYGGQKMAIIGVCLDESKDKVAAYLKQHPELRWPQLFEPGGLESRLATQMGIVTAPLLVVVDAKGLGASPNVQLADLEDKLKELLVAQVASKK